ncbi:phosphatase PAP2 family protein [Frigidibacter sp. MR17.14]|uniref:phosphatase PAP2 family protein n=1 Tax=Frigidibacter sp. MR17.14 TaxID=3126509 RepID=UPI0030131719
MTQFPDATGTPAASWLALPLRALAANRWLLGAVALHGLAALLLAEGLGLQVDGYLRDTAGSLLVRLLPFFGITVLLIRAVSFQLVLRHRLPGKRLLPWLAEDLGALLRDGERLLSGALAFAAILAFCGTFAFVKAVIPAVVPFTLDPLLATIDAWLHGGTDPWRLAHAVFGAPRAIFTINLAYHAWAVLVFFTVVAAAFLDTRGPRRSTYLLAFVLVWGLGGNLAAMLLSSAGPVYYQGLGLGDRFAPLMERLQAADRVMPVWALGVQDLLWAGYVPGAPGRGISAMPSMHVASSVLMALYAMQWSRILGLIAWIFAATIMVGSVLLAWHYAVDGYLGAGVALACWRGAGWLAARDMRLNKAGT